MAIVYSSGNLIAGPAPVVVKDSATRGGINLWVGSTLLHIPRHEVTEVIKAMRLREERQ